MSGTTGVQRPSVCKFQICKRCSATTQPTEELTMDNMKYKVRLSEGFSLSDVTGDGANFSLMQSNMDEAELEPANGVFDTEARLSLFRGDVIDVDSDKYSSPFEYFRSIMDNVTSDGAIKKKIIRTGVDVVVPPQAYVTFHVNAYVELRDEPFDSSVLRGKHNRFKLSSGSLVPGLEQALLTMRRREKAEFLVQPHLAYGKLGCPPRIPPNAEILYEVELLDWTVTPDAEVIEDIDELQLSESVWENAKAQASKLHMEGNDWYKHGKYFKALKAYRGASKLVSNCRLKDEGEEKEYNIFLLKLHTNMGVCNYQLKQYNDVCINCREAIYLDPNNAKAHYYWGQALKFLNEYRSAKEHLLKALKYAPKDKAVHEALNSLEEKIRADRQKDILFCQKAFSTKEEPKKKQENNKATTLSSLWKDQLIAFKNNPKDKRIRLPGALDKDEIDAVCADVEALSLKINIDASNVCVYKDD